MALLFQCFDCDLSEFIIESESRKSCMRHFFEYISPKLDELVDSFIENPSSLINNPTLNTLARNDQVILYHLKFYLEILLKSKDQSSDIISLNLYYFILKVLEPCFFGYQTSFSKCNSCRSLLIDYSYFRLCSCDSQFKADYSSFINYQNHKKNLLEQKAKKEERKNQLNQPFKIWEKLEEMVKNYTKNQRAYISDIIVFYNTNIHKSMWEIISDYKEFILGEGEIAKRSTKKSLLYDNKGICYFVVADVQSSSSDSIELKSLNTIIVLYQLVIGFS